jgi:hypothetical protein
VKQTVREWRPGFELDPEYLARQDEIRVLDEQIRATLAPTGLGGVIDRAKAGNLIARRHQLRDRLAELKATFLVSSEIEGPDGEPNYMTGAL